MLTKYIEQLILSIVADIVQAALGCGPAIKSDEPMKKFPQNSGSYGIVQIGDLAIEQLGAESILVLAEQYGIINQIPSLDDSGEKTIETFENLGQSPFFRPFRLFFWRSEYVAPQTNPNFSVNCFTYSFTCGRLSFILSASSAWVEQPTAAGQIIHAKTIARSAKPRS